MSINGPKYIDGLNKMKRQKWTSCTIAGQCRRLGQLGISSTHLDLVFGSRAVGSSPGGYQAGWSAKGGYGLVGSCGRAIVFGNQFGLGFDLSSSEWPGPERLEWEDLEMGSHVDNPKQGSKVCDGPEIHQQRPSAPMIESMVQRGMMIMSQTMDTHPKHKEILPRERIKDQSHKGTILVMPEPTKINPCATRRPLTRRPHGRRGRPSTPSSRSPRATGFASLAVAMGDRHASPLLSPWATGVASLTVDTGDRHMSSSRSLLATSSSPLVAATRRSAPRSSGPAWSGRRNAYG
ncbi:hypothetical protein DY000_02030319 [Brassica cretica]|uniref:Uncharacterized protein n=1 Tax=Brassica cretica TaxID=69181 RepID=A0ABQ7DW13_BRACR|nr:hypothetical protein DY000_02030319 [Brassica cretica]